MRLAIFSKSDHFFSAFLQSTNQTERFEPNFLQTKNESSEDSNPFVLAKKSQGSRKSSNTSHSTKQVYNRIVQQK